MADSNQRPIVIKKVKKVMGGGHHGGAWKVAYADFTTAMMAFFMLLWLLNVSDKETLEGLADYFSPTSATESGESGAGKPLAGTALAPDGVTSGGSAVLRVPAPPPSAQVDANVVQNTAGTTAQLTQPDEVVEDPRVSEMIEKLKVTLQESPDLSQHKDQLVTEQTPEGTRITLIDKDNRPLFRPGTAELYGFAEKLIARVGETFSQLPNRMEITGHTDASPAGRTSGYTNWELSSDRANAARQVLERSGVSQDRFAGVIGKADIDPLFVDALNRPENRRIAILIVRENPVVPTETP